MAALLDENYGRTEDTRFHWVQVRTEPPGETHAVFIPNPQSYENLTYPANNGRPERVTFWSGSGLGNLRRLCKVLTKAHPWDTDEATWFVLTGEVPWSSCGLYRCHAYGFRCHSSSSTAYKYSLAHLTLNHVFWTKRPSRRMPIRSSSAKEGSFS